MSAMQHADLNSQNWLWIMIRSIERIHSNMSMIVWTMRIAINRNVYERFTGLWKEKNYIRIKQPNKKLPSSFKKKRNYKELLRPLEFSLCFYYRTLHLKILCTLSSVFITIFIHIFSKALHDAEVWNFLASVTGRFRAACVSIALFI